MSWQHIYWQWMNTIEQPCLARAEFCDGIRSFLRNNTSIIRKKATEKGKSDPFWHQVCFFRKLICIIALASQCQIGSHFIFFN